MRLVMKPAMFHFSTDLYPERERLDGWQEEFARRVIMADVSRLDGGTGAFAAHVAGQHLGKVLFTSNWGSPVAFARDRKQAADGDDDLTFLVNRKGPMRLLQRGETVMQDGCGALLVDHGRPFELRAGESAAEAAAPVPPRWVYAYAIPRRALLAAAPQAGTRALAPNPAFLDYLIRYSEKMLGPDAPAHPALTQSVGDHLFDMLVLLTGGSKDATEQAQQRGLRAARLSAILDFIGDNLADPALDRDMIAAAHGIGTRYVSRLMEEHGETLSHHVLRLRLDKAAALLADPASRGRRVSDIAYACGFSDLSYFNRAFRRRFGLSPTAYRA